MAGGSLVFHRMTTTDMPVQPPFQIKIEVTEWDATNSPIVTVIKTETVLSISFAVLRPERQLRRGLGAGHRHRHRHGVQRLGSPTRSDDSDRLPGLEVG